MEEEKIYKTENREKRNNSIADEVKDFLGVYIGERFIYKYPYDKDDKSRVLERTLFINEEGKVMFVDKNDPSQYSNYEYMVKRKGEIRGKFDIDYKMLIIFIGYKDGSIEKIPNTNNTQVSEDYNKKLKEIVEELEELIKEDD